MLDIKTENWRKKREERNIGQINVNVQDWNRQKVCEVLDTYLANTKTAEYFGQLGATITTCHSKGDGDAAAPSDDRDDGAS